MLYFGFSEHSYLRANEGESGRLSSDPPLTALRHGHRWPCPTNQIAAKSEPLVYPSRNGKDLNPKVEARSALNRASSAEYKDSLALQD